MRIDAHDYGEPVEALAAGMRRVSGGSFDTELARCNEEPFRSVFADFNRMTESLLGIEALREGFVSNVAHEFKTPLSYIQGYATLLQDDGLTDEERQEYVGNITRATRRLSDMIGNLLEISSLSRPGAELTTLRFPLDEQLRHVVAVFVPQMERKGIGFKVDLSPLEVEGNASLLEDAWTNLLSNAVKYTPVGGAVAVSLDRQYHDAVVAVSDTGCGMTDEQAAHAFDRFYQGESSHVSEGSGLGLAIVRAVVKKHGGLIRIDSAPNRGTTVTVTIPMR